MTLHRSGILSAAALALTSATFYLEASPIARDGKPKAEIIVAPAASPTERYAAKELQHWLSTVTGVALPLADKATEQASTKLFVGRALARGFRKDLAELGDTDGFAIRQKRGSPDIHIFGSIPRGTLHGVYAFVEGNTDLVWARPEPAVGTVYSLTPALSATYTDALEKPKSSLRGWGWTMSVARDEPVWGSRNRANWLGYYSEANLLMGSRYSPAGGGHGLKACMPDAKYFDSHPEYFPLIDGKRIRRGQLCFLAYEMLPTYLANLRAYLDAKPGCDGMNIAVTDNWLVCDCPRCLAPLKLEDGTIVKPDDPAFRSAQYFTFLNKIAREIRKSHPKAILLTYAYIFTVVPPPLKLEPNIRVMYCPFVKDDKFEISDAKRNGQWRAYTIGWGKATPKTWLREYYGCAAGFPRPLEYTVKRDLLFCLENNIREFNSETPIDRDDKRFIPNPNHVWDVSAMTMWVITRLWWDPGQDVDALRDYYLTRTYRESAPAMKAYYELIRKSWYASPLPSAYSDAVDAMAKTYILEAGIEKPCREALVEAGKRAVHPVSRELVRRQKARFEESVALAKNNKTVRLTVPVCLAKGVMDFEANAWEAAPVSDPFIVCTSKEKGAKSVFGSTVRLLHDRKNLYVRVIAPAGDMATLKGIQKRKDGAETFPSGGDNIEIFVANSVTGVYYQFAYDVGDEAVYEGKGYDAKWSARWTRAIKRFDDRWESIVAIPLGEVGCNVTENNRLKFLVYRSKIFLDGNKKRRREQSSWGGGFVHQVSSFGELTLEQN